MFPHSFLSQIAQDHELSPEQEEVFIMRFGDDQSYEEIAQKLGTSADACLKRMGQVYKKLNVSGNSRGKENRLRISLNKKLAQLENAVNHTNYGEKVTSKTNSVPNPFSQITKPQIYQNLPAREYTLFVGRTQEISRLMELLDHNHAAHLISVDGIGGVGKTTLVLEAAYRCLEATIHSSEISEIPQFQAIIFTSAKQNYLTSMGILPRLTRERTLRDICLEIGRTLDIKEIPNLPIYEQIQLIRQRLATISTLLIIDNLETIEDQQEVLAFLYDLPPSVKVVITTREQALFVPIRLSCLSREAGLRLIQHEAKEKGISLTHEESHQLFTRVSGIPAAIIYGIGQLAAGYLLSDVLLQITDSQSDVARFCFLASVTPLRETVPHYLLMALSLFIQPIVRETIAKITFEDADPVSTSKGLAKLQQLSLVTQNQGYYGLLALTREYSLAELAAHSQFAKEVRDRWVKWYVQFSEDYGGKTWQEWHLGYSHLDQQWENVRAVLEWCITQGRYADVRSLWQHIKGYIHTRGYWDERLDWTDWLITAAKQVGDWFTCVEIMSDRAATLVRLRQPSQLQEAEGLLQEAWNLRHHQTIKFQLELATNMVILYIHLGKLEQAQTWLQTEENLLTQSSLPDLEQQQQLVHILYYRGQIFYQQADYQQASVVFTQALEQAQTVKWQRAIAAIHNWLADIAIKQGNLEQARQLLDYSLPMALENKDARAIAFHQATYAKLEKSSGNIRQSQDLAHKAANAFTSLKMTVEAQEMQDLLDSLEEKNV
ncbi:ATP-binding protein [Calothrix sp. NIES-3974]|uniref:ATP-binding protein n=1 Tax=Calothrix sp. NIES-3974 TaxID=2005462 RepID=UPI000B604073|nr:ATP-binding protein [Calothrix sp. NIES-3974]BAZ04943.1 ECF subfamily RNA polymerase sigma-24 factor [Calothrix sp. NIES-3974]